MWLLERCRKEWEATNNYSYTELIDAALAVPAFRSVINPDAPCFANPSSMIQAIGHYCKETNQPVPQSYGEITRCISIVLPCATNKYSAICNKWPRSPSKAAHYRWRLTKQFVKPIHLQRSGRTCYSRSQ